MNGLRPHAELDRCSVAANRLELDMIDNLTLFDLVDVERGLQVSFPFVMAFVFRSRCEEVSLATA